MAQRVRACSNPAMVIDLARSVLVALFWAAGRGADGSAMQATKLAFRSRPLSSWDPTVPPEPLAPPLGGSGGGERLLVLDLNVEITKSGHANTAIFVPVLAVLGPQPPPWAEEWSTQRFGRKFILPDVQSLG